MFGADTDVGATIRLTGPCCKRHKAKCDSIIDEGYQAKLIRFNGLIGKMDAELKNMHSAVKGARKECGSHSFPSAKMSMSIMAPRASHASGGCAVVALPLPLWAASAVVRGAPAEVSTSTSEA
eukprot:gene47026-61440_t